MTQPGAQTRSVAAAALIVFTVPLVIYLASGRGLPDSHDAAPNAYLPVRLLAGAGLAFSPLESPWMFHWSVRGTRGNVPVDVRSWDELVPASDLTFAQYYQGGRLEFIGPRYFLAPTVRARAATGEPLFVSAFGPAAGLVGLPVAAAGQALGAQPRNPYDVYLLARITAALLTAGSVAMVFLTALGFTTQGRALLLAGAYALGSCVWTLSSQALWQQTSELFFLSVGALFMVRGERAWLRGAATGLAFALAAACRPTAALVALAAACYLLMSDRRAFAAYLLAALPVALSLLAYNLYYFGVVLEFGQLAAAAEVARIKTGSSDLWQTPLWLGAAGLLLSPSRGLLVYTPFLAAAFAGAALAWKEERYARLRVLTVAIAALWLPAFAWFDWWGGWTYGYRPIVDSAPLLAMLCAPAIDRILSSQVWKAALAAALAWSVFIQVLGVLAYTPWQWNARSLDAAGTLANIDFPQYRYRLWSVQDSQIAYLIGNFESARAARRDAVAR